MRFEVGGAREVCQNVPFKSHARIPSSMLGHFLEYSVAAQPLAASFEFFESLGFSSIPVNDTLSEPYLVCFDGAIAVGLHDRAQDGPRLTFVRPSLRDYERPLRRLGVTPIHEHLRDNEFNSLAFRDPGGAEIVLLEARTFPPGDWDANKVAVCGEFFEISLPTTPPAAAPMAAPAVVPVTAPPTTAPAVAPTTVLVSRADMPAQAVSASVAAAARETTVTRQ